MMLSSGFSRTGLAAALRLLVNGNLLLGGLEGNG
jgi:hypothetical protein